MSGDLRCGRLDDHEAHEWQTPAGVRGGFHIPPKAFHCTGHIVTAYAERRWADDRDAEDAADDLRRAEERELAEYAREGWAS